jgi:hypothetical protein
LNGSYSIKDVLPALVDGYSYENMAISDGEMASAAWVRMIDGNEPEEKEKIHKELLEYCHLDTLAMVLILNAMTHTTSPSPR